MKKTVLILMVLGLAAAACAPKRGRGQSFQMTPIAEMATGTLKLEGTADAVSATQAAELLPMWEVYKQLASSDTAAPQEIDGLTQQIQETMTDAQRQSITAMKLSTGDMFAAMQTGQGGSGGSFAGGTGTGTARQSTTGRPNNFAGGPPAGGFGGGGFGGNGFPGGFGGGGGAGTSTGNGTGTGTGNGTGTGTGNGTAQSATQQLTQLARPRVPTPLINAVIAYLKTKAGG